MVRAGSAGSVIEGITEGREEMRLVPNVGPEALARVRRAQALNDDIDWTVDDEDEKRALAMWRPLARQYPEDLAVMHGYVLALSRQAKYGDGETALVAEFRDAALRLLALDDVRWIAASFAGSALVEWAKRTGEPSDLERALELYVESFRRATDDRHRAYALHDQAAVLRSQGRRADALERTERALKLDPTTRHMRFDVEW